MVQGRNVLKLPQTGGSPGDCFSRQEETSRSSPNSGKIPGEKVTRQDINNQQLAETPQGEHSTEDSLRFDMDLEALGESTHPTKDKVFSRKMAAYGRPNNVASQCTTHLDSAPPPVAVEKGTADWLSESAVRSALRLKKVGLPGLIASVRGETYTHYAAGALPHKAAPLLDHMRQKVTPVKIDRPPLTPEQLSAAIAYGSHNSCNRDPSFLRTETRDFVEKGFWIVLPLEDAVGLNGLRLSPAGLIPQRERRDRLVIDYTWSGINKATRRLSPDSMQFVHALQLILQRMYDADPRHGPIYMMKVDIADGFYV